MAGLEGYTDEEVRELAALANDIARNPKTRGLFLQATKTVRPDTPIPEIDMANAVGAALAERDKKIAELEKARLDEQTTRQALEARKMLREKGYADSDEDVAAIEKLMVDEKIVSHETAGKHFRMQRELAPPAAAPVATSPIPADNADLMKDPKGWARREAARAIQELGARRRSLV